MRKFRMNLALDNDAVQEDWQLADVLRRVADRIESLGTGVPEQNVRDLNGNTIGTWAVYNEDR